MTMRAVRKDLDIEQPMVLERQLALVLRMQARRASVFPARLPPVSG